MPLPPQTTTTKTMTTFGTTLPAASWNGERAWSVIVYRRELVGWKQLAFDDSQQTTSSTSCPYSTKPRKVYSPVIPRKVYSPVIPRKGCIVLPALKQKWTMQNDTATGTVIRRGDKILLRSQGRARILMLQFTSLDECLSFSDVFVELNPRHDVVAGGNTRVLAAATPTLSVAVSPIQQKQQSASQDYFSSQQSDSGPSVSHSQVAGVVPAVAMPSASAITDAETDQRAINGMIARLLHDRDFLHFVHKIEQYVLNTEDGSKMLQGLHDRDLSQA
jgi:hypothetical protein